ncbi:hypothetical protein [Tardiphaga sp.]|nr:hypothetical protein [Tardiphaga sp.]
MSVSTRVRFFTTGQIDAAIFAELPVDKAFTCNRRINRLPLIYEQRMTA